MIYLQLCPEGSGPDCVLCGGRGALQGNGAAINPVNTRSVLSYEPVGRNWDDVIRVAEEA